MWYHTGSMFGRFVPSHPATTSSARRPHARNSDQIRNSANSRGMNTYKKCVRIPFRMNTCKTLDLKSLCFQHLQEKGRGWVIMVNQHPAKCAGPERPSGAEGTLFRLTKDMHPRATIYPERSRSRGIGSRGTPLETLFGRLRQYDQLKLYRPPCRLAAKLTSYISRSPHV